MIYCVWFCLEIGSLFRGVVMSLWNFIIWVKICEKLRMLWLNMLMLLNDCLFLWIRFIVNFDKFLFIIFELVLNFLFIEFFEYWVYWGVRGGSWIFMCDRCFLLLGFGGDENVWFFFILENVIFLVCVVVWCLVLG